MKQITIFCLALLLLMLIGCKHERTIQYEPVEVDTAAIADSIARNGEGFIQPVVSDDVYEIPDMPANDPEINMDANDYDLRRVMMGKE